VTEKKENKPPQKQDYEDMIRQRVSSRAVSLRDKLYESVNKPDSGKKIISDRTCLSESVTKADNTNKTDNTTKQNKQE
jgi:hypothetical protein